MKMIWQMSDEEQYKFVGDYRSVFYVGFIGVKLLACALLLYAIANCK